MTELILTITELRPTCRKGRLFLNGRYILDTLEPRDMELQQDSSMDTILAAKALGKCAIPYGRYQIQLGYSAKLKHQVPILQNVPGFLGILMHEGNDSDDTEGCILVGMAGLAGKDWLQFSLSGFRLLMTYLVPLSKEDIFITINPNILT